MIKSENHALNARLNDEFRKFYPSVDSEPIIRDVARRRYWIDEALLTVNVRNRHGKEHTFNLATTIIEIIDAYVSTKKAAFESFIETASGLPASHMVMCRQW